MKNTQKTAEQQVWSFLQVCDKYGLDIQSSEGVRIQAEVLDLIGQAKDSLSLATTLALKFRLPVKEVKASL